MIWVRVWYVLLVLGKLVFGVSILVLNLLNRNLLLLIQLIMLLIILQLLLLLLNLLILFLLTHNIRLILLISHLHRQHLLQVPLAHGVG